MNDGSIARTAAVVVRDAAEADMEAVARIYAHYVEHGLATFEEVAPTVEEMLARRSKALAIGAPYLVAEIDGEVVGYCYAAPYHARPAYRHTLEDSVYVASRPWRARRRRRRCSPN